MSTDRLTLDDLIMLDWDLILVENLQPMEVPVEPGEIDWHWVEELLQKPWYRVEHPTRGVWLAISRSDVLPMAVLPEGQTFQEWDIDLSLCKITPIPDSLKRWSGSVDNGFFIEGEGVAGEL